MLRVGLTGNVAAGKSTVARLWAKAGVPVLSADDLARAVVVPGSEGLRDVVEAFGSEVLAPDGSLDRAGLRARVFADPGERARLEAILHPRIRARRDAWLEEQRRAGAALVVTEIPLLFETGSEGEVDVVVLVDAPEVERRRRLVEDRGLSRQQADRILDAQMDPARKRAAADHVLENAGTVAELEAEARALLQRLQDRAGAGA